MNKIACFDVGGTFIKYAIIDETGKILFKSKEVTPRKNCKEQIPSLMEKIIKNMRHTYEINGIGISTAGNVDTKKGEIIFASDNIPGYTGAKLAKSLFDNLNIPCFVENDVNSAALGESWLGAGKDTDTFLCMTLGTGIGASFISEGRLIKGVKNGFGEIGHMIIVEDGRSCGCGGNGCYEKYASTSAFVKSYEIESGAKKDTLNGKIVFEKVIKKDPIALKVYDEFIYYIVTGLVNSTHLLDPGLILIGGGISEAGDKFFSDINKELKKRIMPSYDYTYVKKAELGNDAGLLGVCKIVLDNIC